MSRELADLLTSAGDVKDAALGNVDKPMIDALEVDAATVTDKTVAVNVPSDAVFTDTTYDKAAIDAMGINAATVNGKTVATSVPSGAVFTPPPAATDSQITTGTDTTQRTLTPAQAKLAAQTHAPPQVQSDMGQTNTSAIDYVKNQPTLGTAAAKDTGTGATNVILGNDSRLSNSRQCNNTFDDAAASRSGLGLGDAATKDTGTGAANVILGNDSRLTDSRTCNNTFDDANLTKANLSLDNVENKSSATIRGEIVEADIPGSITRDSELSAHTNSNSNPHSVTKAQVGLGNVDNTSDANKQISIAQQTALDGKIDITAIVNNLTSTDTDKTLSAAQGKTLEDNKVDKVSGKALSTNDLTDPLKTNYDTAYTHSQAAHAPSNATANDTDANLQNRANHTGTQAISTVTGLQTALDGKQALLTYGIANTNTVKIDSADVADNEYARFTANGVEGRTTAEMRADLNVEDGATADQEPAEIETAYNTQVPQVSSSEITAGTGTDIRRFTSANIKEFVDVHAGASSGSVMDTDYNAGTLLYATADNTPQPKTVNQFSDIFFAQNHYLNGNKVYASGTTSSPNTDAHITSNSSSDGWEIKGATTFSDYVEITGSKSHNFASFGFLNSSGNTGSYASTANENYSLIADKRLATTEVNVYSDARLKNILRVSDADEDAATLEKIKITDFQYKETGAKGKGVIAQQLKEVFPQAVKQTTRFIPDIFKFAEKVQINEDKATLTLTNHGLSKGDFVHLESSKHPTKIHVQVVEATADTFTFMTQQPLQDVFVVGRRVNDCLVVDCDAVAMLAVSGLQHEMKARKKLENRVQQLEEQLEKILGGQK